MAAFRIEVWSYVYGRFCRYHKYMPAIGEVPFVNCQPITGVITNDDLFKWKRSPWIRQMGALLVCEESEEASEAVMVYNVHHSKMAVQLIERAMSLNTACCCKNTWLKNTVYARVWYVHISDSLTITRWCLVVVSL